MTRRAPLGRLLDLWSSDRALIALPVALLALILLAGPLSGLGTAGRIAVDAFFSLFLLSGIGFVAERRRELVLLGVPALATFLALALVQVAPSGAARDLRSAGSLVYCALLASVVARRVFRGGDVDLARVQGAIALYLLVGLAFTSAYRWILEHDPGAFEFARPELAREELSTLIYYSFVTLTTVGYGDVTPARALVRSLATLEALVGQLFPAILLARLVALEVQSRSNR